MVSVSDFDGMKKWTEKRLTQSQYDIRVSLFGDES